MDRPGHIIGEELEHKPCRFGYCTILYCTCGLPSGMEWGLVACPHKKNENGTLRWFKYPDMAKKSPVSVKENTMRKRKRSHKRK